MIQVGSPSLHFSSGEDGEGEGQGIRRDRLDCVMVMIIFKIVGISFLLVWYDFYRSLWVVFHVFLTQGTRGWTCIPWNIAKGLWQGKLESLASEVK